MTIQNNEEKWREEFENSEKRYVSKEMWHRLVLDQSGEYISETRQARWDGYLAARKKGQEENQQNLLKALEIAVEREEKLKKQIEDCKRECSGMGKILSSGVVIPNEEYADKCKQIQHLKQLIERAIPIIGTASCLSPAEINMHMEWLEEVRKSL